MVKSKARDARRESDARKGAISKKAAGTRVPPDRKKETGYRSDISCREEEQKGEISVRARARLRGLRRREKKKGPYVYDGSRSPKDRGAH